jgi:hypothetical protein
MHKVRAYKREDRKALIIHVFATDIQAHGDGIFTCSTIAKAMDITPSTKLRNIIDEMVSQGLLISERVEDTGIAGFRTLYSLNVGTEGFAFPHHWTKHAKRQHEIRLNPARSEERLVLS